MSSIGSCHLFLSICLGISKIFISSLDFSSSIRLGGLHLSICLLPRSSDNIISGLVLIVIFFLSSLDFKNGIISCVCFLCCIGILGINIILGSLSLFSFLFVNLSAFRFFCLNALGALLDILGCNIVVPVWWDLVFAIAIAAITAIKFNELLTHWSRMWFLLLLDCVDGQSHQERFDGEFHFTGFDYDYNFIKLVQYKSIRLKYSFYIHFFSNSSKIKKNYYIFTCNSSSITVKYNEYLN